MQPLSKKVYSEVLDRILTGDWKPGHVFNRRQIALELKVSVAPVLEAMLELESEGLIVTAPRKGTRVRAVDEKEVRGRLIVREALECAAARLYCGAPIEQHLPRLQKMAVEIDAGDWSSPVRLKLEVRFHHYLVSLAGVPALTDAFERVMKLGLLYAIQLFVPADASGPTSSHADLLEALKTTDPDVAEAAIRTHARMGKGSLFDKKAPAGRRPKAPTWLKA